MVNGVNYSGSEVEMNPTVPSGTTPTEATGCRVDNNYYSFPSGGGGGGSVQLTELYSGTTNQSIYNLSDSVYDYDLIIITCVMVFNNYKYLCNDIIDVNFLKTEDNSKPYFFGACTDSNWILYQINNPLYQSGDGDEIVLNSRSNMDDDIITKVIGVKYSTN